MTGLTWSCGHHDSAGAVCGAQAQFADAPTGSCGSGHHPSHWSPLPLWRCTYRNSLSDRDACDDQRLGESLPVAPCRDRHDGWWVMVDAFAPPTRERTPQTDDGRQEKSAVTPLTDTSLVLSPSPTRERLPETRSSVTRRFKLRYQHKDGTGDVMRLYFTAGTYPDGRLGEVFVRADRTGSLASGSLDAAATMISLLLQHGVALSVVTSKLRHTRFGPGGFTGDPEFPSCSSPLDLLAQWLERRWGATP